MEFLSLLIVFALLQFWGSGAPLHSDQWFYNWLDWLRPRVAASRARVAAALLPLLLFMLLCQYLLAGALFGLPALLLFVAVLLYSLGRGDHYQNLQDYLRCWRQGHFETAFERATRIGDFDQDESISDHISLHRHVRKALFYEAYQRWFAVVFWFLLLGPAGALVYRLSYLYARESRQPVADRQLLLVLLHYLDWLPARILALSFALTGNFVHGFQSWWERPWDDRPVPELLDHCGCAALDSRDEPQNYPADQAHFIEYGDRELHAVHSLLSRSVICWMIGIALLQLV